MNEINTQIEEQKTKITPKFFFLSLGVLVTLITTVVSFLNLAFQTLDFKFPDVLNSTYQYGYNSFTYDGARMAVATLIIFFPIFLMLMKYWIRAIRAGLGKLDEAIRKWMLYLVLFLSAILIAVDLVTLVRYFVSGEITNRFILKVAVTLIAGLFVGMYFIFELNGRKKFLGFSVNIWSAVKASVFVLALAVWTFTVIGTPGQQRVWRLDDRRVQDLTSVQYQVINYWQQKQKLPEKLSDMATPTSYFNLPVDPEFEKGKTYEYKPTGALSFELCATFGDAIPKGWQETGSGGGIVYPAMERGTDTSYPYPGPQGANDSWKHDAGRTCFERTIDKDLYPPYPVPMKG